MQIKGKEKVVSLKVVTFFAINASQASLKIAQMKETAPQTTAENRNC